MKKLLRKEREPSWSWSYGSRIFNNLYNQCLSQLCDKVCQWLATGRWFSPGDPGDPVSSINKTYCHDITEILLKVALNTIILTSLKLWEFYRYIVYIANDGCHIRICDKVCQWLAVGRWFCSRHSLVSSSNKTAHYTWNIVESGIKHWYHWNQAVHE